MNLFLSSINLDWLGYLAAGLLTIASVPQLIKTYQMKDVSGLSALMLWTWFLGCFLMMFYVYFTTQNMPLFINYVFNSIVSGAILALYGKYRK